VLIGKNAEGDPTCGPCSGTDLEYRCKTCQQAGNLYAVGECARCVLNTRLADLLSGPDGTIDARLTPLHQALQDVPRPVSTLVWLSRCPAAQLLLEIAADPELITHDHLDRVAQVQAAHYLRGLLVHTGALSGRDEPLDRIGPWLDRLLADRQRADRPDHAHLIRPFTHWYLLPKARRRAKRRQLTDYSAETPRTQVLAALDFLDWIQQRSLSLDRVDQHSLDYWLTTGPPRRYEIAAFLAWTTSRQLSTGLHVPRRQTKSTGPYLDDHQYAEQLQRCINDTELPLDVRLSGALALLFGLTMPSIARLTDDDVDQRTDGVHLRIGEKFFQLPPRLADLVRQQLDHRSDPSAVSAATGLTRWLFPGMIAGRPLKAGVLAGKLNRHGITGSAARNTARRTLAANLPATILADLADINISTAIQWTRQAKTDWTTYIADRAANAQHEREKWYPSN
jgi:hypothetical protein